MQDNNLFTQAPVNNAGVVRNNGSVDICNTNKRSSYSFTLSRVGLERELDDYLKGKTAKGTGLTISTYVRDLINRDYKNQLDNRLSFDGNNNIVADDMRNVIINTKVNTDNIIDMLSSLSSVGVANNNTPSMFNSNVNADTNSLLMEIYKHVSNNNNNNTTTVGDYNIDNILQIISDKLSLLDAIEKRIASIGGSNQTDSNTLEKIDSIYKYIELQNKKIDRLEDILENGFESVISLLRKNDVINGNTVCCDEDDDCTDKAIDIAALLANDIGDDDE